MSAGREAEAALVAIIGSCRAIEAYAGGSSPADRMAHDAMRMRLVDIGAAVAVLPDALLDGAPDVPWARLRALGELLVAGRPEAAPSVVRSTAAHDVPELRSVAVRLRRRLRDEAEAR